MKANHNKLKYTDFCIPTVSKIVKSQNESKSQRNRQRIFSSGYCVKDR